jgi:hypothetical protein
MGSIDKLIRLFAAIVITVLYYMGILTGTLGIISLVIALILTITSLVSFCPLYYLLGIKTCNRKEN